MPNPVLDAVRLSLGRAASGRPDPHVARPPILALPGLAPRPAGTPEAEIDLLLDEINKLSGVGKRVAAEALLPELQALVQAETVKKAVLWTTPGLAALRLSEHLAALGVEIVPAQAGKQALAQCDLGITEADFALPETGTLGLLSSPARAPTQRSRLVSLLPRVHLAILRPAALRADLHAVFADARQAHYLVLITGPSRTADIELTVTLGVHGPKALYAWVVS